MDEGYADPFEKLDNIQEEIAALKRQIYRTHDPFQRFLHYNDLITAGLQAIDDRVFRDHIKESLESIVLTDKEFWFHFKRNRPAFAIYHFIYGNKLPEIQAIWDEVAVRLKDLSIIVDRHKGIEELADEVAEEFRQMQRRTMTNGGGEY